MQDVIVDALATYRITRLVVEDEITGGLRGKVIEALDSAGWHKVSYAVTCPWCSGMYVAAAVVAARRLAPRLWGPVATALALSAAAGLLSGHEES